MTDVEQALLVALQDLDREVTEANSAGRRPEVVPRVMRLRVLAAELPPGSDPMLMHCLERQSWEKARMILDGRRAEVRHGDSGCT